MDSNRTVVARATPEPTKSGAAEPLPGTASGRLKAAQNTDRPYLSRFHYTQIGSIPGISDLIARENDRESK
jgi:hypothetical protein